MRLVLETDFSDYYDDYFDKRKNPSVHHTLWRFSKDKTPRLELLSYMKNQLSLIVPEFGTVREVANRIRLDTTNKHVVVYHDEFSHYGDGKEKVGINSAFKRFPLKPCSLYMSPDEKSESLKYVSIGLGTHFLLKYTSNHGWKSNVGDVSVELLGHGDTGPIQSHHYPVFSIDFVVSNKIPYAVDFNASPKLGGTPIENIMPPDEVVREIKSWIVQSMS